MKKQLTTITLLVSLVIITQSHAMVRTRSERAQAAKAEKAALTTQAIIDILAKIAEVNAKKSPRAADTQWLNDAQQKMTAVLADAQEEPNSSDITDTDIQTLTQLRLAGSRLSPRPNRFLN